MQFFPLLDGYLYNSERRSDTASSKRASITLRHHPAFAGHKFGAEMADGFISGTLFEMHGFGFLDQRALDLRKVGTPRRNFRESRFHSLERPKKVHCGGSCLRKSVENYGEFRAQTLQ